MKFKILKSRSITDEGNQIWLEYMIEINNTIGYVLIYGTLPMVKKLIEEEDMDGLLYITQISRIPFEYLRTIVSLNEHNEFHLIWSCNDEGFMELMNDIVKYSENKNNKFIINKLSN